jgi:2-amino-4-hydroxy-6-hydroxymethyldihydropteridine diphosphokinase
MNPRLSVFLGLGSNLGDRALYLDRGLRHLEGRGFRLTGRSSLYETEPVGGPPQGPFLNMVARGETDLSPDALLGACLDAEREQGRVRAVRNAPRTLDVDVLLYGDLVRHEPDPVLPHPRMADRRFVLVPLAELDPEVRHPAIGLTAAELLARCPDRSAVALYAPRAAAR